MKIYFFVEGQDTEPRLISQWLRILTPNLTEYETVNQIVGDGYCVFSGKGFCNIPSLLPKSIVDVNRKGDFDYFVIMADAENLNINDRIEYFRNLIGNSICRSTRVVIIVQNICIETWLLGNSNLRRDNYTDSTCQKYIQNYDVTICDPELMPKHTDYPGTKSKYHHHYLQLLVKANKLKYNKNNITDVSTANYLNSLIDRNSNTGHISSFRTFIDFCSEIKQQL